MTMTICRIAGECGRQMLRTEMPVTAVSAGQARRARRLGMGAGLILGVMEIPTLVALDPPAPMARIAGQTLVLPAMALQALASAREPVQAQVWAAALEPAPALVLAQTGLTARVPGLA